MPPHEQNEQTVRGSGGTLSTTTRGTVETDNYAEGGAFDVAATDTPTQIDLGDAVAAQQIVITASDNDTVLSMTLSGGDVVDLPLNGGTGSFDKWECNSITVKGGAAAGGWAGE